jgi:hypothetical protein
LTAPKAPTKPATQVDGQALGHVSQTTTSRYLHEEEDRRYRETVKRHRMNREAQPAAEPGSADSDH